MSRPASQRRLSVGSAASSLPVRNSYGRVHSHSTSLGSANTSHRVNRRKSSIFLPSANAAAVVKQAVADGSAVVVGNRDGVMLGSLNDSSHPSNPPHPVAVLEEADNGSAMIDGPALASLNASDKTSLKTRRASEGVRLTKKERAATGELKCEQCGKAYKHGSCLTKHLWEHTPQWQVTSKLLISKHQQVQLLEAASVLVAMNQDGTVTNDSDNSSSPAASGSSGMHDDDASSTETTPPPQADQGYRDSKRYSNNSSAYSRSYQSVFSSGSVPTEHVFSHHRDLSTSSNQPMTAGTSIVFGSYRDEDPQDLAAAVGLLSCSYGTPKSGPTGMPSDVPPVPPLPAKYANTLSTHHSQGDVEMDEDSSDDEVPHHHRADEADDGVFGTMDA